MLIALIIWHIFCYYKFFLITPNFGNTQLVEIRNVDFNYFILSENLNDFDGLPFLQIFLCLLMTL